MVMVVKISPRQNIETTTEYTDIPFYPDTTKLISNTNKNQIVTYRSYYLPLCVILDQQSLLILICHVD